MNILETDRLLIREIVEDDAPFINALLNSPGFLKYIGDRGVRSDNDARTFIHERLRKSYEVNGYGLYAVLLKTDSTLVGMCGFVRRDTLPGPDLGFAFLPEFEGKGFGTESSLVLLDFGRDELNFDDLYAITTLDNAASIKLLEKLGFRFDKTMDMPNGETLKRFSTKLN
jgi:ribosomal-protein-alanine N-acetyltransferase